jgi:hypothetical protein
MDLNLKKQQIVNSAHTEGRPKQANGVTLPPSGRRKAAVNNGPDVEAYNAQGKCPHFALNKKVTHT